MIPYSEGTLNVNNGGATVTGNATYWSSQVRPGDKLTLDHDVWYLVASVESDTSLTLDVPYHGATALTQDYVIVRDSSDWGMNAEIARDVTELMQLYKARLLDVLTHKFQVLGYYATLPALQNAVTSPAAGALYGIGESAPYSYYQWDGVANQWKNLGVISVAGNPGNSLRVRSAWAENTVYDAGENGFTDIVYCDNACFACMAAHTSAAASKPNEGVSWRECWALLVAQGEMPNHEWNDTSVRFQRPDGTWGEWVDVLGPATIASDAARAKASEAASSAGAAAASSQAAQTSANNATSSAEQAAASANAASGSEQNAAQSALAAGQSASAAAGSQAAAANSASDALASKNVAQASASAAATSETAAAGSAQNAAQSAQAAAQNAAQAAQTAQSVNQWRHRGEWASGTNYLSGEGYIDVVEHDGSGYVCLAAHQATTANEPGAGANSADFWRLLAEKGQPGEQGVPGIGTSSVESIAQNVTETVQSCGDLSGSVTIDATLGNVVTGTVTGALTLSVSNVGSGCRVLTFIFANAGAAAITWPNGIMWPDAEVPEFEANKTAVVHLLRNGGNWLGCHGGNY